MLRMATSYFYHIRFFKPYMIPLSTALWDPKWYHNFYGQDHVFIDKNGVMNGLRIRPLMPGHECDNLCRGTENCATGDPNTCAFLRKYGEQLDAIDFNDFIIRLEKNIAIISDRLKLQVDPLVVFIVHEAVSKPCSERREILRWLRDNDVDASELCYPIANYY